MNRFILLSRTFVDGIPYYSKYGDFNTANAAMERMKLYHGDPEDVGDEFILLDTAVVGAAAVLGHFTIEITPRWVAREGR